MKALLYCTKAKPTIEWYWEKGRKEIYEVVYGGRNYNYCLNGEIVAECEIETERIEVCYDSCDREYWYESESMSEPELLGRSCLTSWHLYDYLKREGGYAIHVKNLKVFDKPLTFEKDYIYSLPYSSKTLARAPQNMCNAYDRRGYHYVLISIRPEWICRILNGEKDIEVRKKVLNCMK